MATTLYLPTEKMRTLTYREWKRMGGNNITQGDAATVARALGQHNANLDACTIGQITDICTPAGRGVARYANENFPKSGFAVVERVV